MVSFTWSSVINPARTQPGPTPPMGCAVCTTLYLRGIIGHIINQALQPKDYEIEPDPAVNLSITDKGEGSHQY